MMRPARMTENRSHAGYMTGEEKDRFYITVSEKESKMIPQESRLLQLLSNNDVTFFIPPYQRNYEWTDEQCQVLLEDIKKTYDLNMIGKTAEHFFGTVTYFQDETPFQTVHRLLEETPPTK